MQGRGRIALLFSAAVAAAGVALVAPPAHADNPIVRLVSTAFPNECLQPGQGAPVPVIQMACNGSTAQQWTVEPVNSTRVHLRNRATQTCMDAFGSAANGTPIVLWPCNGISNENWSFGITNNLLSSGVSNTFSHCVATPGAQDGLAMELRFCDGNSLQLWNRPAG